MYNNYFETIISNLKSVRGSFENFLFSSKLEFIFSRKYNLIFVWIIFYANIVRDTQRITNYSKSKVKIGFTWRKKFEIWIRSKDYFIQVFHSSVHSFIHSFFSFFLSFPTTAFSREIEWNRVRFIRARSTTATACLPPPCPCRARAILHSFDERGATLAHPLPISVSQLPRRRRHARCDRCALKLVSQLAYHDLDSIAHENESASPSVSPLFPFRFPPLSSVQRIKLKRRKDASTASNGRIFQFLEKLFNFHSLEEFRPNPCYTININMDRVIHGYIGYVVRLNWSMANDFIIILRRLCLRIIFIFFCIS